MPAPSTRRPLGDGDHARAPPTRSAQVVSFTVSNDNPALFTGAASRAVAADGTLTYTPAADASGAATVTVRAVDDGGSSGGGGRYERAADVRDRGHRGQRCAGLHRRRCSDGVRERRRADRRGLGHGDHGRPRRRVGAGRVVHGLE